jgi:hypothetical protein
MISTFLIKLLTACETNHDTRVSRDEKKKIDARCDRPRKPLSEIFQVPNLEADSRNYRQAFIS